MASAKLIIGLAAVSVLIFGSIFSGALQDTQQRAENNRLFDPAVGITSPLSRCTDESGCTLLAGAGPALYIQTLSDRAFTIGLAADQLAQPVRNDAIHLSERKERKQLSISKIGHSRITVGFDESEKPLNEYRMHVLLTAPMVSGERYELKIQGAVVQVGEFTYRQSFISPSIQVNQVGYLPHGDKRAFAGNWLGTAGPMAVADLRFSVINVDNGKAVFHSELALASTADRWSGNAVYRADFSDVQSAGKYYLSIPGLGRSHTFSIANEVFKPVFQRVFRLFYHSRNSTAISPPWADTGFERSGGIHQQLSAYMHPAVASSNFSSGEKPGSYKMVERGWFDAGDYGQYVVNAAPVWHAFGVGIDLMPATFSADDFNLPESNNGIPDIIDELEWGMDWLLDMQNQDNGGVYSRLVPLLWDDSSPPAVQQKRYLFEITTHATASFVAMTALHSRLISPHRPERAAEVLSASRAAWQFLQRTRQWPREGDTYKNPKDVHAGEYPDSSATDNRLWAAAELYRTTSEAEFKAAFMSLLPDTPIDPTEGVTFRRQALAAYWSMYQALQHDSHHTDNTTTEADRLLGEQLAKVLITSADWYLRKADEHPFNAPMHQHLPYTGWGSFAHSSRAVLPLLQAWAITGGEQYCFRAAAMSNPQLGANPQSVSYITGTGSASPRQPLSLLSKYDSQVLPLNGIPVNGPHYHLPALWPSTQAVNDAYIPPAAETTDNVTAENFYPPLRRYVDASPLPPMSEPTVAEYAMTAVAYGLLSDGSRRCSMDR